LEIARKSQDITFEQLILLLNFIYADAWGPQLVDEKLKKDRKGPTKS
jgi:hypothetical protein